MQSYLNIKSFAKLQWLGHWSGWWALLNDFLLGYQYTKLLKRSLGASLRRAVFISRRGFTSAYLAKKDYDKFGKYLVNQVKKDNKLIWRWCSELKEKTDQISKVMNSLKKKDISYLEYNKFVQAFYSYGVPHRAVKIVVDFLPNDLLKRMLPSLSQARVYAEPVYAETENFMRLMARKLEKKTGYDDRLLLYLTRSEMERYFKTNKLPKEEILQKRYQTSAILYLDGNYKLFTGGSVGRIEKMITRTTMSGGSVSGHSVYPGRVRGRVKIIFDPRQDGGFQKGDILVTGMTRPEYLPLLKKAAAFVTDAGGLLSHAAITARELKKPCVIGTLSATKILKDGDLVEVDATKGVVRKI